ncbi:acetyltransferase [Erwinia amylovora]|uniref:acetyltransferase n=1 Tax=Erwinia amylovora TaxID=552 RepID=UPI001444216D|nr:acetyltransferase [Erwinia amylovora]
MNITVSDSHASADETFVADSPWWLKAKSTPVDIHPLTRPLSDEHNYISAGLVAKAWQGALDIQYLWVGESRSAQGMARDLMQMA